ncbi:MAG: hypothetical protein WKG07_11260 [Hymenobacter sp.]
MLLCVIAFSIERALTIAKAKGSSSIEVVCALDARQKLNANDISGAIAVCDQQKGSVANVVARRSEEIPGNGPRDVAMNTDQRVLAIQKEIEESTALKLAHAREEPGYHLHAWLLLPRW